MRQLTRVMRGWTSMPIVPLFNRSPGNTCARGRHKIKWKMGRFSKRGTFFLPNRQSTHAEARTILTTSPVKIKKNQVKINWWEGKKLCSSQGLHKFLKTYPISRNKDVVVRLYGDGSEHNVDITVAMEDYTCSGVRHVTSDWKESLGKTIHAVE